MHGIAESGIIKLNHYGFVKVTDVEAHQDHTLLLTFETGEKKTYDFTPELDEEIFQPLQDLSLFLQAKSGGYAVVWNDDIDIASEHLYYNGTPLSDLNQ
jgi:hypothetical protein